MRISIGIILSILSANAFAIEHFNGAHSGSLLARRAVVADTDGPFLQKRNNDKEPEEQEEQDKPKVSVPGSDSDQEKFVHTKDLSEDDPDSNPNTSDGAEEGSANSPIYDPNQSDEAEERRGKVYTVIIHNQQRLSFVDAFGDFSSRVLSRIRKGLFRAKLELELLSNENRFFTAAEGVYLQFGGEKGDEIGNEVYALLVYALKISKTCERLYKDPAELPFSLKLPTRISNKSKKEYKALQDDVLERIKLYISVINTAIESIGRNPENVVSELREMMEKTNAFYEFLLSTKPRYSSLLEELELSNNRQLEGLEMHIQEVETYRSWISKDFNKIKEMVEDHQINSNQQGTSKALSPILGFKELLGINTRSSEDGASGSAQSEDIELKDLKFSNDE
ncbi:hypothetical protein BASA50_004986 [Batrachochytrium salamandrivorans]|uniref:Uncharacterized protein n=1 Tax=Batrachochytrium salamandrivorans TaxID=1357716 RepID=A0ABQ8FE46_9FUNG|nr:hypothetical protein BASA50_004986 [Batrachochytrium salamandrivorans]